VCLICHVFNNIRSSHNPKVGGSNPPPATNTALISNGLGYRLLGRLQFGTNLGQESGSVQLSQLFCHVPLVRRNCMRVLHGRFRVNMSQTILTNTHRRSEMVQGTSVPVPEAVTPSLQSELPQNWYEMALHEVVRLQPATTNPLPVFGGSYRRNEQRFVRVSCHQRRQLLR